MKKIIIAEDEALQRKYFIKDIKEKRGDKYIVAGEASDGMELLSLWKALKPDMIICDLYMPKLSGFEAIKEIRKTDNDVKIIVLTCIEEKYAVEMLYPIIDTYLLKIKETPEELLEKIDQIAMFGSPHFQTYVLDILKKENSFNYKDYEMCKMIKDGLSSKEIADIMFVSVKTVNKRLQRLMEIFNTHQREELIVILDKERLLV